MRFSTLLFIPSRLTSLVKLAYNNNIFLAAVGLSPGVTDIVVRNPFLLNFSEPIHRNTQTVESARYERKSFYTYFHLQQMRKIRGDRQYQKKLFEETLILLHSIVFIAPYFIIYFHRRQCVAARDQWD
jgi:hypothetical protein